jgi:hypothetical protein
MEINTLEELAKECLRVEKEYRDLWTLYLTNEEWMKGNSI